MENRDGKNSIIMPIKKITEYLNKSYPQNYIIKKPLAGAFTFALICYLFLIIYRPQESHASSGMSYPLTMALYCIAVALFMTAAVTIFKRAFYSSINARWSIKREIAANVALLLLLGSSAYLSGFMIEDSSGRLNIATICDSFLNSSLLGSVPLIIISLINSFNSSRYNEVLLPGKGHSTEQERDLSPGGVISIVSKLKKEELTFYTDEFIYAKADGNYVEFYLKVLEIKKKVTIRNFINETELQFLQYPYIMRVHRKFIVNLKKIESKKGNALSLKVRVTGEDEEIPVSRNKIKEFNDLLKRYRQ
jgi:hypothetical protein